MSTREVVILSGVRTPIGDYGGALKDFAPSDLGARVIREAVARAKVDPAEVGAEQNSTTILLLPSEFVTAAKHVERMFAKAAGVSGT